MSKTEVTKADLAERQALYDEEYEAGYSAYMAGEPSEKDPASIWLAGWNDAKEKGETGVIVPSDPLPEH